MKAKSLLALIAGSVMFCASHAASVDVTDTIYVPEIVHFSAGPVAAGESLYYELINTSGKSANATVTLTSTNPVGGQVLYNIFVDDVAEAGTASTGATVVPMGGWTDDPSSSAFPFFTFIMQAGVNYILQLTVPGTSNGLTTLSASVSTVPLPGAIWLFGSALLGFLGFSSRRKV